MVRNLLIVLFFALSIAHAEDPVVDCVPEQDLQGEASQPPSYQFTQTGLINLERLLEDNPDFQEAFIELSDADRAELIEIIEQFNAAFKESLELLADGAQTE